MAFSELDLKRIDRTVGGLCRKRSPREFHDQLRLEYRVARHEVLLFEVRPAYREPSRSVESPVAKLRFTRTAGEWRLFWQRASLKWQSYEPLPSSRDLAALVEEVDRDPLGCFFG
jgi:DUF3024 family protein